MHMCAVHTAGKLREWIINVNSARWRELQRKFQAETRVTVRRLVVAAHHGGATGFHIQEQEYMFPKGMKGWWMMSPRKLLLSTRLSGSGTSTEYSRNRTRTLLRIITISTCICEIIWEKIFNHHYIYKTKVSNIIRKGLLWTIWPNYILWPDLLFK